MPFNDYGVDITAPQPPFVLFQVLYYKTPLGYLIKPFVFLFSLVIRLLASIVGYIVGFMFGDEDARYVRQPVSRDYRIPRPVWGPDLSMMEDEYL